MTDAPQVPWLYGTSTAHLAKFMGGGLWQSRCSYRMNRTWLDVHWTGSHGDAAHPQGLPLTPWCLRCASLARREASAFYAARLLDDLTWVVAASGQEG